MYWMSFEGDLLAENYDIIKKKNCGVPRMYLAAVIVLTIILTSTIIYVVIVRYDASPETFISNF